MEKLMGVLPQRETLPSDSFPDISFVPSLLLRRFFFWSRVKGVPPLLSPSTGFIFPGVWYSMGPSDRVAYRTLVRRDRIAFRICGSGRVKLVDVTFCRQLTTRETDNTGILSPIRCTRTSTLEIFLLACLLGTLRESRAGWHARGL